MNEHATGRCFICHERHDADDLVKLNGKWYCPSCLLEEQGD